jgi:hypothetical protein
MPIARQLIAKHTPATMSTVIATQRRNKHVFETIEEAENENLSNAEEYNGVGVRKEDLMCAVVTVTLL